MLVNRNPLEITASAQRLRLDHDKAYGLALWERYLREGLAQIGDLPVLVVRYENVLADPVGWCAAARDFLARAGVPVREPQAEEVAAFIETDLRHTEHTRDDVFADADVSEAQRGLFEALETLDGGHDAFTAPSLPDESATTEALLAERRRVLQLKHELELERRSRWSVRVRNSRYAAPARPLYARGRRLLQAFNRH